MVGVVDDGIADGLTVGRKDGMLEDGLLDGIREEGLSLGILVGIFGWMDGMDVGRTVG